MICAVAQRCYLPRSTFPSFQPVTAFPHSYSSLTDLPTNDRTEIAPGASGRFCSRARFAYRLARLALSVALAAVGTARAATTTYTLPGPNGGNWTAPTTAWTKAGGDAPGATPNRAGDVATGTTSGSVTTTLLDSAVTIGALKEGFGSSWTINASGAIAFTFDGTGLVGSDNGFGNAGVASIVNSSGGSNFTLRPNIVMTNTDLDIGYTSGSGGTGQLNIGTLGTNTITNADGVARTITLRSNSSTSGNGAITINSSIGATGGAINLSNQSTGNVGSTIAGAIGGATGTGAAITISNTAAGSGTLTLSGTLGASVSSITQNSATSRMVFSGTSNYTGNYTVSSGILQFTNRASLYNSDTTKWNETKIAVSSGATLAFNIGGATQFTIADINSFVGAGSTSQLLPAGSRIGLDTTNGAFNYNSVIADANSGANSVGLTKLGSNTLTLSALNTYSGPTTISGGILSLGIAQGSASGPLGLSAAGLPTNTIFFNGGSLQFTAANTTDYSSRFSTAANNAISIDTNSQTVTFASAITGSGVTLAKIGAGTLILTGANTYTGATSLGGGATSILQGSDATAYTGASNTLKSVFGGNTTISVTGGILQLRANGTNDSTSQTLTYNYIVQDATASTSYTIDVDRQAASGGTGKTISVGILNSAANVAITVTGSDGFNLGTGQIQLGGGSAVSVVTLNPTSANILAASVGGGTNTASPTLKLDGTTTGNVIAGTVANASSATSIVKSNTSTWTLAGTGAYSGGTTINQGTLLVNNTSGTGTGAVVVNGALAGKLGGTGTISAGANSVTVNSGAFLSPGNGNENSAAGVGKLSMTFTTGTLSLLSGSKFVFDLATTAPGTGSDLINVTAGALTLGGQKFSDFSFNTLAGFDVGTYTLFQTATPILGSLDANAANLTGTVGSSGLTGTLAISGNNLVLTVIPEPGSLSTLLGGFGVLLGLQRFRRRRDQP